VTSAELRVDVAPAWDGVVRPGGWTELAVRVVSDVGGEVRVDSSEGALHSATLGRVEAGVAAVLRLPVRVGTSDRIAVVVRGPGEVRRRVPVTLRLLAPDERVVARAGGAVRRPGHRVVALGTDAASLPSTARAFDTVDVLVLDVAMLAGLEGPQLRALEGHLGRCGRVVLVDAPGPAIGRARDRAGCDGAFVEAVHDGAAVDDAVARLLAHPAPRLPDGGRLAALLPGARRPGAARSLAGFFAGYGAALVLGAVAIRRAWLFPALPLAATALLVAALRNARPEVTLATWTETTSGAATARFAAVLAVDGMAPRALAIDVPPALGVPDPVGDPGTTLALTASAGSDTRVAVRTALLSEHRLELAGTLDWTAPLAVEAAAGTPRVVNTGPVRSRPGFLVHDGDVFRLPALDPGAAWNPAPEAVPDPALPADLTAALGPDVHLLALLPGTPGPILEAGTTAAAAGWIVIRARQTG
jgi:hypothetical protein